MAAAASVVVACAGRDGVLDRTDETDRQIEVVGVAISYPRQASAAGFARAALRTSLAERGSLSVLEMRDLTAEQLTDMFALLVVRIDGTEHGWLDDHEVRACYRMLFNHYGIVGEAESIPCPPDAFAVTPPPQPNWETPDSFDPVLRQTLADLPARPEADHVWPALRHAYLVDEPDKEGVRPDPFVDRTIAGPDVGVSFLSSDGICLLASRVNGTTLTWRPPPEHLRQGTQSCDANAALTRQGASPR